MRSLALLVIAVCMSGCGGRPGGLSDALKYNPTVHHVTMDDDTYRVFEHPSGDRLMTTPSVGTAAAAGLVQGATLGLARPMPIEERHEAAARRHLDQTGRAHCRIASGYEIIHTQYEFKVDCAVPAVETSAPGGSRNMTTNDS